MVLQSFGEPRYVPEGCGGKKKRRRTSAQLTGVIGPEVVAGSRRTPPKSAKQAELSLLDEVLL